MRTRRAGVVLAGLALAASALACSIDLGDWGFRTVAGDGEVVTEAREVSGFTSVQLAGWGRLHIEVGESESLTIEADRNLLEYIETTVTDGQLDISHRRRVLLRPSTSINYYLTVVELEGISVSGAGDVNAPAVSGDRMSVRISGAGSVEIDGLEVTEVDIDITGAGNVDVGVLNAERLDVDISGAGDLSVLAGEVLVQEIGITGGGNHQARGLQCAEAAVRLSGFGGATLRVSERLQVSISGAGSVRYIGSPSVVKNVTGVGNVVQIDS
jgi:hypothetical protein